MENRLLLGINRHTLPIPKSLWQRMLRPAVDLGFMSPDHHRVRNFVVIEIPRLGKPLSAEYLSQQLDIPIDRVTSILGELEKRMTFLYRNEHGEVAWAYPITAEKTPHHMTFSTGERIDAAWAIDAIATPFVQGRLRSEKLEFTVSTECGHCGAPLHLEIDSELNYQVGEQEAQPLIYVPLVDFQKIDDPSIIDQFWKKSIFLWSEEHVKQYRKEKGGERGAFLTLAQSIYLTRQAQSGLFGFGDP